MSAIPRRARSALAEHLCHDDASVLLDRQMDVLELVASAAPVVEVLEAIITALEEMMPGAQCSILLLDSDDGRLRHAAAPSLSPAYLSEIDGLRPGPAAGSCGTAVHLGRAIVAPDIRCDDRWVGFRRIAVESGLVACWSTPIAGPDGAAVGTFAVYHGTPHEPTDRERRLVEWFTHIASVAVEHNRLIALRQAHREAEVARRIAEDHSTAKSALLTSVSHEIRTPLQAIKGFTELLSTLDLEPERREEALARINSAANHLLSLVTDVLDISRAEANALPLRPATVELSRSVDEVVDLTTTLAADREVSVRTRLVDEDRVRADPDRLRQVLLNLIGNALRHGRRRGCIDIVAHASGHSVVVEISDDGPGIPEEVLSRIFAPFARGASQGGTTEPVDGHGLGLMLAHGLVIAMNGELAARNSDRGGAVFTLRLPRAQDETERST